MSSYVHIDLQVFVLCASWVLFVPLHVYFARSYAIFSGYFSRSEGCSHYTGPTVFLHMWVIVYSYVKPEVSTYLAAASWFGQCPKYNYYGVTIDSSYIVYRLPPETTSTTMAARSKGACTYREESDWLECTRQQLEYLVLGRSHY